MYARFALQRQTQVNARPPLEVIRAEEHGAHSHVVLVWCEIATCRTSHSVVLAFGKDNALL